MQLAAEHPAAWPAYAQRALLVAGRAAEAGTRRQQWEAGNTGALCQAGDALNRDAVRPHCRATTSEMGAADERAMHA